MADADNAHVERLWAEVERTVAQHPDDAGAQVVVRADDVAQLLHDNATMAKMLEPGRRVVTVKREAKLRPRQWRARTAEG